MNKHLIIYHAYASEHACLDGFGAAWAAHRWLHNHAPDTDIRLYEGIYGNAPPYDLIDRDTVVHILDFSYPSIELNVIYEKCAGLIILDHHKSAMENFIKSPPLFAKIVDCDATGMKINNGKAYVYFNMNMSGAMMAWKHYSTTRADIETPAPRLIHHIQDNDLYKFQLDNTKPYISALASYSQDLLTWNKLSSFQEISLTGYSDFISEGTAIDRAYRKQVKDIIKSSKRSAEILGIKGLVCNTNDIFKDAVATVLAKESGTFGATYFHRYDNGVKWSLRSIGNTLDVSKLAMQFGGGGHKNAAGFIIYETSAYSFESNGVDGRVKLWTTAGKVEKV